MDQSVAEVAWLAGILEGEGSFWMLTSHVNGKRYRYPKITVNMTDRDVVERVAAMFGGSVYDIPPRVGRKPAYRAQISGSGAAEWMRLLYPWLGDRRRSKVDEVLAEYERQASSSDRRRRSCAQAAVGRVRTPQGRFTHGL